MPAQAGVNLNVLDDSGRTPADLAKGDEKALKLILEVRRRGGFSHMLTIRFSSRKVQSLPGWGHHFFDNGCREWRRGGPRAAPRGPVALAVEGECCFFREGRAAVLCLEVPHRAVGQSERAKYGSSLPRLVPI